jgi:hypothetical protein
VEAMLFWGKSSVPDTSNMWIPHTRSARQFFHGEPALPEFGSVYNDFTLIFANSGVIEPTINRPLLNSGNLPSITVTSGGYAQSGATYIGAFRQAFGPEIAVEITSLEPTINRPPLNSGNLPCIAVTSGGYAQSGAIVQSEATVLAGTACGLSGTTTAFSFETGLVSVNPPAYDNFNTSIYGIYSHLHNLQPAQTECTTLIVHGFPQLSTDTIVSEAATTITDPDGGLDAARDIYIGAFRQAFGPEIAVEITSFVSDGEIQWRFTTRVPRALYDDVERLLDLEDVAHEHVRALTPALLGFFSFQYSPDDGETSGLS